MERFNTKYDKYTKIWSGPKAMNFFDEDCSIGKIIFAFMNNNPNRICQLSDSDDTALTNGEAICSAIRIAQYLRTMGIKQDDVVGIIGFNSTYLMPVILGCMLNCTPFHAISPQSDEATVKHLFCITRPKLIFCDGDIYGRVSAVAKMIRAGVYTLKHHRRDLPKVGDLLDTTKSELFYVPETLKLGGDQTVAILCTSGTTGLPKCVCISNSACLFDFGRIVTGQDVVLSFSTLDWAAGMFNMLYACVHSATRIITDRPYNPDYLMSLVYKYKVTILSLTTEQIARLVKYEHASKEPLSSIRFLSIQGMSCHVSTLIEAQKYLTAGIVKYGYALTECGCVAANIGISKPNAVGKLLPGLKVKILDEAGRSLGHNETGEIVVSNGKSWNGYYANPNETKRIQDGQGWFHTGDLGYFDGDNYLHVVNRKGDVLRFHGTPYYPHEIEEVIAELPDVIEACVLGLWNEVDGDAAAAAVVKTKESKISEQDIVEHVAKRLIVKHKQLHCGVFFLNQLPKTATSGQVLRDQARDMALGKKWQPQ